MARCGCGGSCGCTLENGTNTTVTGAGSASLPYQVHATVDCSMVSDCLNPGPGIEIAENGTISACVSGEAGNRLSVDDTNCLFVPPGDVITGCGLTGDGSAENPFSANTSPWGFPGSAADYGSAISCDANGVLRGEAPYHTYYFQSLQEELFPENPPVPTGTVSVVHTFSFDVTNPDPARPMRIISFRDLDVDLDLPAGSGGAFGISTDEMYRTSNTGSSVMNEHHVQLAKLTSITAALAPGATQTLTLEASLGRGSGGATYNRVQGSFRTILIPF